MIQRERSRKQIANYLIQSTYIIFSIDLTINDIFNRYKWPQKSLKTTFKWKQHNEAFTCLIGGGLRCLR